MLQTCTTQLDLQPGHVRHTRGGTAHVHSMRKTAVGQVPQCLIHPAMMSSRPDVMRI